MTRPCVHRTINYASDGTATCTRCVRSTNIGTLADKPRAASPGRTPIMRHGTKRGIAAMFAFNLVVEDALIARGATRSTYDRQAGLYTSYAWTLDTPLGPLGISPQGYYVVCRFARRNAVNCVPKSFEHSYNDKWNHHYDLGHPEAAADFIRQLDAVLAMNLGPEPDALDKMLARIEADFPSRFAVAPLPR